MKKKIALLILIMICVGSMSGCMLQTADAFSPEERSYEPAYKNYMERVASTYYDKYMELETEYGKAEIVENGGGIYGGCSWLSGVCVVSVMDFNGDGIEDLFVVYSNGQNTGKNMNGMTIPKAGAYEIEIWTYAGTSAGVKQLLHEPLSGSFSSFRTAYWDEDNCMVTVYKNDEQTPVIQLYSETDDCIFYTNLYNAGGTAAKDTFCYDGESFTMNGEAISENVWNEKVNDYNQMLLHAYLSNPSYTSDALLENYGVDYNDILAQTAQVAAALSKSQVSAFQAVEEEYRFLYMMELDRLNRTRLTGDIFEKSMESPYEYALYDIDQNGVPELIILAGDCEAAFIFQVYTVSDGKLVHCGEIPGFHTGLYTNGAEGLASYAGHMGWYEVNRITLSKQKLKVQQVATGEIDFDEAYPALAEFGLGDHDKYLGLFPGTTPILLYTYAK